jgi:hypothetical protein
MFVVLEFLLEFIVEYLFLTLIELLVNGVFGSFSLLSKQKISRLLYFACHLILGILIALLSLKLLPKLLIPGLPAQVFSLVLTPLLVGLTLSAVEGWKRKDEEVALALDKFIYGYFFALSIVVIRFIFLS